MTSFLLFLTFAKFGLLCFGGGFAVIPLLAAEMTTGRWRLSNEMFANLVSIAQVTPGPVGINVATYVGYLQGGWWTALAATLGLSFPGLVLVLLARKLLKKYEHTIYVQGFNRGIRPAAYALILTALVIFLNLSVFTAPLPVAEALQKLTGTLDTIPEFGLRLIPLGIATACTLIQLKSKLSFYYLILASAIVGALFCDGY